MADPRVSFPVLEDAATQAGLPLHKAVQGDSAAARNAHAVIPATDAAGNLQYPKVDSQRRLYVSPNVGDYANLSERGELAAGSATFATVTGALITLVADLVYQEVGVVVSCTRDAHFQVVQVNDVTETILADVMLEGGESTFGIVIPNLTFTAGSTGTQSLKVVGKNMNALSALRATVSVTEVQP